MESYKGIKLTLPWMYGEGIAPHDVRISNVSTKLFKGQSLALSTDEVIRDQGRCDVELSLIEKWIK